MWNCFCLIKCNSSASAAQCSTRRFSREELKQRWVCFDVSLSALQFRLFPPSRRLSHASIFIAKTHSSPWKCTYLIDVSHPRCPPRRGRCQPPSPKIFATKQNSNRLIQDSRKYKYSKILKFVETLSDWRCVSDVRSHDRLRSGMGISNQNKIVTEQDNRLIP